ncbi:MAG: diguanylate cyclase [Campylobacterales bacterium]|nr:diguanylate cyclase [Campylobacterales bacterium]
MKNFKIVLKVITPLIILLTLIAAISIYSLFILQKRHIVYSAQKKFENINYQIEKEIQENVKQIQGLINLVLHDEKIIKEFQNQDRERLLSLSSPIYEDLEEKYHITHFYFHNLDKKNFLRVHNPKVHSDLIKRVTLEKAKEKSFGGIESGIYHNPILRVVTPLRFEREIIGYIEIGKEFDVFTKELSNATDGEIIFTLDNNPNGSLTIESTIKNLNEEFQQLLLQKKPLTHSYINNNGIDYYVSNQPFYDISKKQIGTIYVAYDVSIEIDFLYELVIKTTIIIALLLLFLFSYYYKCLKDVECNLNKAYNKVQKISITDELSTLYNKRHFNQNSQKQIKRAERHKNYISFIIIDIDNFKKYNDTYGHLKGDKVIEKVGKTIKATFQREDDYCYRIGGEEFAVICESSKENEAVELAHKLKENIKNLDIKHKRNESYNKITVSIGISFEKATIDSSIDDLYNKADEALYFSKGNGRNRVALFDSLT